ncbi:hypothetical protein ACFTZB_17705 [Rhodococcus sp. NPDC057014]|uniref:hypothetical protein n=1 Tax=Rhodococcus sp. NPDC057014 TaxID=3346000 RepID=UPI003635AF5B
MGDGLQDNTGRFCVAAGPMGASEPNVLLGTFRLRAGPHDATPPPLVGQMLRIEAVAVAIMQHANVIEVCATRQHDPSHCHRRQNGEHERPRGCTGELIGTETVHGGGIRMDRYIARIDQSLQHDDSARGVDGGHLQD